MLVNVVLNTHQLNSDHFLIKQTPLPSLDFQSRFLYITTQKFVPTSIYYQFCHQQSCTKARPADVLLCVSLHITVGIMS